MPLKKRSRKKKTDASEMLEPMTQMTASQLGLGSTGKTAKPKKPKLTKAEKSRAKLEKSTDALRKSGLPFLEYLERCQSWLIKNQKKCLEAFHRLDETGEGAISYDEFKAVIFDLDLPCNRVELHLLCQLLDPDQLEEIDYLDMDETLKQSRERECRYTDDDIRPSLKLTDRKLNHCPSCKTAVWDGEPYRQEFPRFIEVMFKLVTFDNFREHQGHFSALVQSHITVFGLMQLIVERTKLSTTQLAIFTDKSREPEVMLPVDISMEDCGFKGGPKDNPQELVLYYDYKAEFVDCPILMCDHYFGEKLKL